MQIVDPFNETALEVFVRISALRDELDGPPVGHPAVHTALWPQPTAALTHVHTHKWCAARWVLTTDHQQVTSLLCR